MDTTQQPSRFDYVKYDDVSIAKQARLKACAQKVEVCMARLDDAQREFRRAIEDELDGEGTDAGEKAITELREAGLCDDSGQRLEQAYMWCGKAIRDQQIERNGSAELQEERTKA